MDLLFWIAVVVVFANFIFSWVEQGIAIIKAVVKHLCGKR